MTPPIMVTIMTIHSTNDIFLLLLSIISLCAGLTLLMKRIFSNDDKRDSTH